MNILYLSCHDVLEYYDISLLSGLGHNIISIGSYNNPLEPFQSPRPSINIQTQELSHLVSDIKIFHEGYKIHPKVLEWADAIIVINYSKWVECVIQSGFNKPVILRTIGQNLSQQERAINSLKDKYSNVKIVRYSPREQMIPNYKHSDALIRFYLDDDIENTTWVGDINRGLIISQNLLERKVHCNTDILLSIAKSIDVDIFGRYNKEYQELTYEEYKNKLARYRYIIYSGTMPASYTLTFIEAMGIGIPIIALDANLADSTIFGQSTYEIPFIINNGDNGFLAKDTLQIITYAHLLCIDYDTAKDMSNAGKQTCIDLFSKNIIKAEWDRFLKGI